MTNAGKIELIQSLQNVPVLGETVKVWVNGEVVEAPLFIEFKNLLSNEEVVKLLNSKEI